jgi:hypothetical protein
MATLIASCVLPEETLKTFQLMYEPINGNGNLEVDKPFIGTLEAR